MTDARVFVLGAGRAGRGLARALRASGIDVVGVHGRHVAAEPEPVTAGVIPPAIGRANTVLVAVRDAQLEAALAELSESALAPGAVVLHASGSAEPRALEALRARGHPTGTFHPLVPLTDAAPARTIFEGARIGIDGDDVARATAEGLAAALGAHTLVIPPGAKARYHAAAVMASNFPAVLFWLGERMLEEVGIEPPAARAALRPLLLAAAENLQTHGPAEALTGPIARGDVATVRRHLDALHADGASLDVYRSLSRAAADLAADGGTDPVALAEIRALIE